MRALLSVSDKSGIVELATALVANDWEILSTGGTFAELKKHDLSVTAVSDYTGAPEMLGGRVKTLHPKIHAGILANFANESHRAELRELNWKGFALVVVNLYPFGGVTAKPDHDLWEALENIDIGGPTLLRAAAKNFPFVMAVCDPSDYPLIIDGLPHGGVPPYRRRYLAHKAFEHVAEYDRKITDYLASKSTEQLPPRLNIDLERVATAKYGENPHQQGGVYRAFGDLAGVANAKQVHGAPCSYLNYLDADAAYKAAAIAESHTVAIIKHANPCGVATAEDQMTALERAIASDSESAYGGVIGCNTTLTKTTATALKGKFFEVIVAPGYDEDALEILQARKKLRLLQVAPDSVQNRPQIRTISGGYLVQENDDLEDQPESWKQVTKKAPTAQQKEDLLFAWRVCRLARSNAIVVASDGATIGIGAGQPSRLRSVRTALQLAADRAQGAALASDAFFPFADGVEVAAEAGISAIVQPGGSIRDAEVTEMADKHGIAMMFTERRAFAH